MWSILCKIVLNWFVTHNRRSSIFDCQDWYKSILDRIQDWFESILYIFHTELSVWCGDQPCLRVWWIFSGATQAQARAATKKKERVMIGALVKPKSAAVVQEAKSEGQKRCVRRIVFTLVPTCTKATPIPSRLRCTIEWDCALRDTRPGRAMNNFRKDPLDPLS